MNVRSCICSSPSSKVSRQAVDLSSLLKLVSEESRLKILCILRQRDHCVCEIMEHVDMSQSLISHHLKGLRDADIVSNEKKGVRVYYFLTDKGKKIINLLFQIPQEVKL